MSPKHPPGPPMTLGNMRGVHHLIAFCLNDASTCRAILPRPRYRSSKAGWYALAAAPVQLYLDFDFAVCDSATQGSPFWGLAAAHLGRRRISGLGL